MSNQDQSSHRALAPLLTLQQVAEYLGISQATVRRLIDEENLPAVKIGRAWRFSPDTLEKWLAQKRNAERGDQ